MQKKLKLLLLLDTVMKTNVLAIDTFLLLGQQNALHRVLKSVDIYQNHTYNIIGIRTLLAHTLCNDSPT